MARKAKARTVAIHCDAHTAAKLAEAIRGYTNAAYPAGGSDCSQVSRAALLATAGLCEAHGAGELLLRRRQLALLRTGVRWYFSEDGPGDVESLADLEALLVTDKKSTS